MVEADQQPVIAFLRDPASYGPGVGPVETIETHISIVFLVGDRAYKLKRAVKYPYLDFSSPARRRRACVAELRLNRRTAPELYLEVRAIVRGDDGRIGWGKGDGAVDWVVVMRRFDQEQLLDRVARRGALNPPLMLALVAHIAAFHAVAEPRPRYGGAAAIAEVAQGNFAGLRLARTAGLRPQAIDQAEAGTGAELVRIAALLDDRRARGKVRHCHGDLHLRNICLLDGRPVLFDGIEFSEELAAIDVLYDLAFLLMDLQHRDDRNLANLALNRYLDLTGEDDGLAAIPLFISLRAAVRASVTATAVARGWSSGPAAEAAAEAERYLDEAALALGRAPPRLIAIGGLSGSGKSALAARLAPELGVRPGARVLRSDVVRKRGFGVMPETPLPAAAYRPAVTRRVYAELRARAAAALCAGYCVILDAVALAAKERRAFAAVAEAAGVAFCGLWLEAPAAAMAAHIATRRGDASDASAAILARQLRRDPGPLDWIRIDAGGGVEATLAAARRVLAT